MSGMTDHEELRVSNDAMDDAVELQRRIAEEGYLFFRRLQDPDKLRALRREMMSAVQEAGWLVAGTDPSDGIADVDKQCTEGSILQRRLRARLSPGIVPSLGALARDYEHGRKDCRKADYAAPTEGGPHLVSAVYRPHDAHSSGLCALSG